MSSLSTAALCIVMFLAGVGIPFMAALNAGLGTKLGNPAQAATLLFGLALVSSFAALWLYPRPISLEFRTVPIHYFLGGLLILFYVLAVTVIAPRIGVGTAIMFVLLGQLVASAAIDHFAWLGAPQSSWSATRALGLLLMAAGAAMARGTVSAQQ